MKKYNKQIIFDYIAGNDIEGYNIDELENDAEFMKDVITMTKDKNMLNLCSDEIKRDYEFVKTVIHLFKDDIKLICKVADDYLKHNRDRDEEKFFELNIIMQELTKHDEIANVSYLLGSKVQSNWDDMCAESIKDDKDEAFNNYVGLGFVYYLTKYPNNEIILNYVANEFLDELFISIMDLEVYIHKNFKSYEELEAAGKHEVLFKVISKYDQNLLDYVKSNEKVLSLIDLKLQKIKYGWNSCEMRLEDDERYLCSCIVNAIHKYMDEYWYDCDFKTNDMKDYITEKLGIKERIERFYPKLEEENIFDDEIDEGAKELYDACFKKEMGVNDFKHCKAMRNLVEDILNGKVETEYDVCEYHDAVFNPNKQKKKN